MPFHLSSKLVTNGNIRLELPTGSTCFLCGTRRQCTNAWEARL